MATIIVSLLNDDENCNLVCATIGPRRAEQILARAKKFDKINKEEQEDLCVMEYLDNGFDTFNIPAEKLGDILTTQEIRDFTSSGYLKVADNFSKTIEEFSSERIAGKICFKGDCFQWEFLSPSAVTYMTHPIYYDSSVLHS